MTNNLRFHSNYDNIKANINNLFDILNWTDLMIIFQQEPIVIKDCYNFKLKHVTNAFYEHGFIETIWDKNDCSSGLGAIMSGLKCEKESQKYNIKIEDTSIIEGVKKYNEVDCKVMWEMIEYLRKHNI